MSGDFGSWDNTPYPPDPPSIERAAKQEQKHLALWRWIVGTVIVALSSAAAWAVYRALNL